MNDQIFFATLRKRNSGLFGTSLSQTQVDFLEALLVQDAALSNAELACVMGNTYHECKMIPKRENMSYSSGRIAEIFSNKRRQGKSPSQLARNPELLANTVYGGDWGRRNLGNTQSDDGWRFRGGPGPQLTGRTNYAKFGLENMTEAELLNPAVNARVAIEGMRDGKFRGLRLSDFLKNGRYDFKGARAIVNADKNRRERNGQTIGEITAAHCRAFLLALQEADRKPQRAARPVTAPKPTPASPSKPVGGFWAILAALFGRK